MSQKRDVTATKIEGFRELVNICLRPDIIDLRELPISETALNLGLDVLMVLVAILHLALGIWQFATSLLLVGYDLTAKILTKIMPSPETAKESGERS